MPNLCEIDRVAASGGFGPNYTGRHGRSEEINIRIRLARRYAICMSGINIYCR